MGQPISIKRPIPAGEKWNEIELELIINTEEWPMSTDGVEKSSERYPGSNKLGARFHQPDVNSAEEYSEAHHQNATDSCV